MHRVSGIGDDEVSLVVVDAQEVERERDHLEIVVSQCRQVSPGAVPADKVSRIVALEDGVEEPPVLVAVDARGRLGIARGGSMHIGQVERDADPRPGQALRSASTARPCPSKR